MHFSTTSSLPFVQQTPQQYLKSVLDRELKSTDSNESRRVIKAAFPRVRLATLPRPCSKPFDLAGRPADEVHKMLSGDFKQVGGSVTYKGFRFFGILCDIPAG